MVDLIEEMKYIESADDIYGTYDKAKCICEYLELESNRELLQKNNIIAIYGPWGSGKSCLMKNIEKDIDRDKFETVWFDTWKYEKDDNLAYSLFKFIGKDRFLTKLKKEGMFTLKNAFGILASISKGVEINMGNYGTFKPGEAVKEAQEQQEKLNQSEEEKLCLWEKMKEFEDEFYKLSFNKKRLVVFLDDLDRCESENIISLISSTKLLLSKNPNIIFVIGIDREAVTLALQNKYHNDYNKADEYLEKIFTINFEVANKIKNENFKNYIKEVTGLDDTGSELIINYFRSLKFNNPRHIKKVLRKYYSIKNYLSENQIKTDDVSVVILCLYFIILNNFQRDEYKSLFIENRKKIYKNVVIHRKKNDRKYR